MGVRVRRVLSLALTIALGGCQTVGGQAAVDGYYLGLMRVRASETPSVSRRIETLGVWLDGGVGAGWRDSRRVEISGDCQVVFLVASAAELETARAWVKAEENDRGKLCVALQD
jgi:hypothetical protein